MNIIFGVLDILDEFLKINIYDHRVFPEDGPNRTIQFLLGTREAPLETYIHVLVQILANKETVLSKTWIRVLHVGGCWVMGLPRS